MQPLKVGIISANWGMAAHLPAWRSIEGVEVAAVCTSRRETAVAAAKRHGIAKAYWDHRAMSADPELDIIDVGTRPDLRETMVVTALASGKHVYAGANLAASLVAARAMRDAARAGGRVVALDTPLPRIAAHRQAATMLANGWIGRPVSVATRFSIPLFNPACPHGTDWRWFARRAHGASALRNLGTHTLHLLVSLLGPVAAVACTDVIALPEWRFGPGDVVASEVEDTAFVLVRFESGVIGTVHMSWSSPTVDGWHMALTGTEGTVIARDPESFPTSDTTILLAGRDAAAPGPVPIDETHRRVEHVCFSDAPAFPQIRDIAALMADMVAEIRTGEHDGTGFDRAWHVEAVLAAARLAADERRWVDIVDLD